MIIIYILGYLLLALLLLMLFLLLSPVEYCTSGQRFESYAVCFNLSWLLGGIKLIFNKQQGIKAQFLINILGFSIKSKEKTEHKAKKAIEEEKHEKKKGSAGKFLNKEFIMQALKSIKELLYHIKPAIIDLKCKYGFEDPFDTAIACAVINNMPLWGNDYNIHLTPIFDDEILEGKFLIQGRVVPAVVLIIAAKFILSRPFMKILKMKGSKSHVHES